MPTKQRDETSYCMKCKSKTTSIDPVEITAKNGTPMVKSKCTDCGSGKCKIMKRSK